MSYWCKEAEKCEQNIDEYGLLYIKGWSVERRYVRRYDITLDMWTVRCGKRKWEMYEHLDGRYLDVDGWDRLEDQGFPEWIKLCIGMDKKQMCTFYSSEPKFRRKNKE